MCWKLAASSSCGQVQVYQCPNVDNSFNLDAQNKRAMPESYTGSSYLVTMH